MSGFNFCTAASCLSHSIVSALLSCMSGITVVCNSIVSALPCSMNGSMSGITTIQQHERLHRTKASCSYHYRTTASCLHHHRTQQCHAHTSIMPTPRTSNSTWEQSVDFPMKSDTSLLPGCTGFCCGHGIRHWQGPQKVLNDEADHGYFGSQ